MPYLYYLLSSSNLPILHIILDFLCIYISQTYRNITLHPVSVLHSILSSSILSKIVSILFHHPTSSWRFFFLFDFIYSRIISDFWPCRGTNLFHEHSSVTEHFKCYKSIPFNLSTFPIHSYAPRMFKITHGVNDDMFNLSVITA